MEKRYILSIDQGTTSSRAILFDKSGAAVFKHNVEFKQHYPRLGWVEHEPDELFDSVLLGIKTVLEKSGILPQEIDSVAITNQRETTLVWDKVTGKKVYNAIVWQCRRTASFCDELKASKTALSIAEKTGLMPDAYFSATKLKWLLDTLEGVRIDAENGKLAFGTIDTYLMWRFSKGKIFKTDYTNASRTMLFNIHNLDYDDELLSLFNIPKIMLPRVCPSSHFYGVVDKEFFGCEIPIMGVAGDQQAALFGQLCTDKGGMKNTYGTGCFLLFNTGEDYVCSKRGLITTLAASCGKDNRPHYALEGSVFIGGAVVQWLRDEMGLIKNAAETEQLALSVEDNGGVHFVPAFVGLGAPYWDSSAKGLIHGITRGTNRAHIVRAALESIAFQSFDLLHAMERDTKITPKLLRVDGGASANDFLMQFQADICGFEVVRPRVTETTALGAAYLAGLKTGFFAQLNSQSQEENIEKVFKPKMPEKERNERILKWKEAVYRARGK